MRIRNKAWHQTIFEETKDLIIDNPQELKGRWKQFLQRDVLHVEIGAGKGDYWLKMSELYPEEGFVAIEKEVKIAAFAMKKSKDYSNTSKAFIIKDAQEIHEWFADKEIDYLHLNFSDPWPKKAHNKRRLTTAHFIHTYYNLLSDEGRLLLKSDNRQFFEYSVEQLSQNNFICEQLSLDFRSEEHPEDVITEYEQRFIDMNQPIYRCIFRKSNSYSPLR